jgi:hypothetical protein
VQTLHSADGERLAHSEGMASAQSDQQARWHPSRSTPANRVRIRELYGQEVHDWMFTMPEPALFTLLHRMMLADPDDRRLNLLSVILVRRLEAGA